MIADTGRHRRSSAKRLMYAGEIVPHVEQGYLILMVLNLLGESIRQPGESAHLHPHGEVLTLNIAGADVLRIGIAADDVRFDAKTLRGAVALLPFRIVAKHLYKLRIVNGATESLGNGSHVHLVAVRGQLRP